MELKRKYREKISKTYDQDYKEEAKYEIKKNCWFRRNISLTGWYHLLSNYGESLWRPTVVGIVIVLLATLFFVSQSNPSLAPTLSTTSIITKINNDDHISNTSDTSKDPTTIPSMTSSSFIGLAQITNGSHLLKAYERSL